MLHTYKVETFYFITYEGVGKCHMIFCCLSCIEKFLDFVPFFPQFARTSSTIVRRSERLLVLRRMKNGHVIIAHFTVDFARVRNNRNFIRSSIRSFITTLTHLYTFIS